MSPVKRGHAVLDHGFVENKAYPLAKDNRRKDGAKRKRRRLTQSAQIAQDPNPQQLRVNDLKKRLRDLIRLMKHRQDMNAGERQYKERELAALRRDLEDALHSKERKDMVSRYHMVRFFERRKAERHLKQTQKIASAAPADASEREGLKDAVHEAEVNLNYTLYSPFEQKYLSLYDNKKKESSERGAGFKSTIWYEVEEAMVQRSLHKLRDRQDCLPYIKAKVDALIRKFSDAAMDDKASKHDKAHENGNEDAEDGGFFEA